MVRCSNMHTVECGVLHQQFRLECLHRVPRRCMCFFLAQVSCSFVCQAMLPTLSEHSCTKKRVGAVAKCNVALLVGHALARTRPFFSRPCCFRAREYNTLRVTSSCGPCGGERLLHKVSGQRRPVKTAPSSLTLQLGFLVRVCSCVTIGWAQRGSSRENVVSSEQFRSMPEGFRSDSR